MSSDLNGRERRHSAGLSAQWERAEKLGPNPYATPGKPDNGEQYAYFNNRVYRGGELVTDVKARVPDFFAATEQQLRDGQNLPGNFPQSLVEDALKAFEADRRETLLQQEVVVFDRERAAARPVKIWDDHRQMAAEDPKPPYDHTQHYGR